MTSQQVQIRELIAWGFDSAVDRGTACFLPSESIDTVTEKSRDVLQRRSPFQQVCPLLKKETDEIVTLFDAQRKRADLIEEFERLDWELNVVDLRQILAFQRRLIFRQELLCYSTKSTDWQQLFALAFPEHRQGDYTLSANVPDSEIVLRSSNPDLQVKFGTPCPNTLCIPMSIDHGSPFFEVAEYKGRWFLRDGYHRAYALLSVGIFRVPAVVIRARTLDELGATHPWFFDEKTLFSERPPQLIDFHDDSLVISYERPPQEKVIRISIEESFHSCANPKPEGVEV
jgi:hypothetical protein